LTCVFYPEKSWTKVSSPHILGHEQGHFDISQLFTRKLHEALKAYKFRQKSADSDIKAIYEKIAAEQSGFQVLYDQQTNYSRNAAEQGAWQERIKQELSNYSEYADYP
jgi:predicted secreted Zn-dependent protease